MDALCSWCKKYRMELRLSNFHNLSLKSSETNAVKMKIGTSALGEPNADQDLLRKRNL